MFLSLSLFLPVCQQNNRNTHGRREGKSQKQNTTRLSLRFASWIFPFKLSILRCKIERGGRRNKRVYIDFWLRQFVTDDHPPLPPPHPFPTAAYLIGRIEV